MMYHVVALEPGQDYGHTWDYHYALPSALASLRYWRHNGQLYADRRELVLTLGPNGEPLRYVVYFTLKGDKPRAISVHRTVLGAKRAYLKFGRSEKAPDVAEYGFMPIMEW